MKNLLQLTFLLALNLLTNTPPTFAGSEGGGGGDASEARVNEIRSDILIWINKGGASGLKLSIPQSHYVEEMKKILQNKEVAISFTEKIVEVEGKEKTCRGYFTENKPQMLCNIDRFKKTSPSDQYRLIHHEYAGLALIEMNEGSASDYEISNQITDFLKEEKVLKLSVIPKKSNELEDILGKYTLTRETANCPDKIEISKIYDEKIFTEKIQIKKYFNRDSSTSTTIFETIQSKEFMERNSLGRTICYADASNYENSYNCHNQMIRKKQINKIGSTDFLITDSATLAYRFIVQLKVLTNVSKYLISPAQGKILLTEKIDSKHDNHEFKCEFKFTALE